MKLGEAIDYENPSENSLWNFPLGFFIPTVSTLSQGLAPLGPDAAARPEP